MTASSCLLLVDVGEPVAFAVDALRSIDPLAWRDPDQPRRGADRLDRLLQGSPLVQVGADTRLLPCLDLQQVSRTLHGHAGPPAPRSAPAEELLVR
ncbi:hypothetical protein O2W18_00600 [Modestobacter sp. VKM Ac-2983]|uniref:hypothetical protein n=1 Tax=Modestobacter sp. VKM Ac-2983 TaxID=3004137 RepID=UPI0022AB4FA9|nr:hypothetical protein [Modestobacter sp. VKM Ac-2983]MCZ2803599.1 hypothetical protein [Modestobacter sp. VKM Ac-2983]